MKIARYGYSLIQKMIEGYGYFKRSPKNILMFHQVNNDKTVWDDEFCSITEKSFYQMFEMMKNSNVVFASLDDLLQRSMPDKMESVVYVTFDDAYDDVYYKCYPYLRHNKIPFSIFIATNYLDKPGYLSTRMVQEMLTDSRCSVGAHTVSHSEMRFLEDDRVEYELDASKRILQERFKITVFSFAYPYGSIYACSRKNINSVKKIYSLAFSTINTSLPLKRDDNNYFLPRKNVNEDNYKKVIRSIICR